MNSRCFIISGGDFHLVTEELRGEKPGFIIACDQGWLHAEAMGLKPDLALGDFDSAPLPAHLPVQAVPSRKDDTDTLLGVKEALSRGYKELVILCAFGGRLDHSIANIQTGAYAVNRDENVRIWLYGSDTRALILGPGEADVPRREGWSLSLFALSGPCGGLCISGSSYEGEDLLLESTYPLGVSNAWREEKVHIHFNSGILMIMESKLKKGEHTG